MMRAAAAALATAALLVAGAPAQAHRIDEYLQATLFSAEPGRIAASMRLIPGELVAPSVIAGIDSDGDAVLSAAEKNAYVQRVMADIAITLDGRAVRPTVVSASFPGSDEMRAGLGEIRIEYVVAVPAGPAERVLVVANGHRADRSVYLANALAPASPGIRIVAQKRDAQQSRYELTYQQDGAGGADSVGDGAGGAASADRSLLASAGAWWRGLAPGSLFRLGMRHIAEGTDHLLFLLALLLPAPLVASGSRWTMPDTVRRSLWRILGIVTAFTVGHSITLGLAAVAGWTVPAGAVEVLIAVSILVSAAHALRPLFPGREAVVAGLFGLVHGLAFASTLGRLGLGRWDRIAGTVAFNLGIEAMQLIVVMAVLPSLLLLRKSPAYTMLRAGGAVTAGAAAVAWMLERALGVDTGVDSVVDAVARRSVAMAALLLLASLAYRLRSGRRPGALQAQA